MKSKLLLILVLFSTSLTSDAATLTSKDEFIEAVKEVPQSDTEVYFNEQIDTVFKDMTDEQRKLLKQIVVGGRHDLYERDN